MRGQNYLKWFLDSLTVCGFGEAGDFHYPDGYRD